MGRRCAECQARPPLTQVHGPTIRLSIRHHDQSRVGTRCARPKSAARDAASPRRSSVRQTFPSGDVRRRPDAAQRVPTVDDQIDVLPCSQIEGRRCAECQARSPLTKVHGPTIRFSIRHHDQSPVGTRCARPKSAAGDAASPRRSGVRQTFPSGDVPRKPDAAQHVPTVDVQIEALPCSQLVRRRCARAEPTTLSRKSTVRHLKMECRPNSNQLVPLGLVAPT